MKKLIWLTDPHLVEPDREWPAGIDPLARLRACLRDIRELHADAERIVISGDLIQLGNTQAYEVLRRELEPVPVPYRLLVGNHDDRDALSAIFPEVGRHAGFIQYAEELDGIRILYLDTLARDGNPRGELCPTRMDWVAEQVEMTGDGPLLVFLHHPPCDIGVPALDRLKLLDSGALEGLLRKRRGLTQLFCGHVHRNVSGLWAGHPFAALKSTHVQCALDMSGHTPRRCEEAPAYAAILCTQDRVVVNYRDFASGGGA